MTTPTDQTPTACIAPHLALSANEIDMERAGDVEDHSPPETPPAGQECVAQDRGSRVYCQCPECSKWKEQNRTPYDVLEAQLAALREENVHARAECSAWIDRCRKSEAQLAALREERDQLAQYAGSEILRSDFRTAEDMRMALTALREDMQLIRSEIAITNGTDTPKDIAEAIRDLKRLAEQARNHDAQMNVNREHVAACNHPPELVIESESGAKMCCECWAIDSERQLAAVDAMLFDTKLDYTPDRALAIKTRLELADNRLTALREENAELVAFVEQVAEAHVYNAYELSNVIDAMHKEDAAALLAKHEPEGGE